MSPVLWRDSLFWAIPLYATSSWYPLSLEFQLGDERVRYLRHAAVALVNAHTGVVTAVPDHDPDPVTSTWLRRFPSIFTDASALDPDLARRLTDFLDDIGVLRGVGRRMWKSSGLLG